MTCSIENNCRLETLADGMILRAAVAVIDIFNRTFQMSGGGAYFLYVDYLCRMEYELRTTQYCVTY